MTESLGFAQLGHWMRDRGKIALTCTDRIFKTVWLEDNPEQRANRYAVELLMPEPMFRPRTIGLPLTFGSVRSLCEVFTTSLTATAIRLTELSSYNAMLTCYEHGRRKWFFRGPDIPTILWPYEQLSSFTKASGLSTIGAQATANVSADAWVNHPESWRYTVKEDSIVIWPGMVLSLIWWQNERQILDLDDENENA